MKGNISILVVGLTLGSLSSVQALADSEEKVSVPMLANVGSYEVIENHSMGQIKGAAFTFDLALATAAATDSRVRVGSPSCFPCFRVGSGTSGATSGGLAVGGAGDTTLAGADANADANSTLLGTDSSSSYSVGTLGSILSFGGGSGFSTAGEVSN